MLKLTFTLGPASLSDSVFESLAEVADRFRLNAAHLSAESLLAWIERIEDLAEARGKALPVVLDLQGAKMRIGNLPTVSSLPEIVQLVFSGDSTHAGVIPVPHRGFFEAVHEGDEVTLNDGKVLLQIQAAGSGQIEAKVLKNGPLSSKKGINRSVHPLPYREVTAEDRKMIELTSGLSFIEYAFSFVHNGEEAPLLRSLVGGKRLIAKIERPESMAFLSQIDAAFDELWLCRGDLGAQAGLIALGPLQEEFTSKIRGFTHPALLAGQVLEHMTHFPEPTRTEVVHLFDVQTRGYSGIVLSDETAIGKNPVAVARFLRDILR